MDSDLSLPEPVVEIINSSVEAEVGQREINSSASSFEQGERNELADELAVGGVMQTDTEYLITSAPPRGFTAHAESLPSAKEIEQLGIVSGQFYFFVTPKSGNTPLGIAQEYGIPLEAVYEAMGHSDPHRLLVGERLIIKEQPVRTRWVGFGFLGGDILPIEPRHLLNNAEEPMWSLGNYRLPWQLAGHREYVFMHSYYLTDESGKPLLASGDLFRLFTDFNENADPESPNGGFVGEEIYEVVRVDEIDVKAEDKVLNDNEVGIITCHLRPGDLPDKPSGRWVIVGRKL